jgi:hypothetical protein
MPFLNGALSEARRLSSLLTSLLEPRIQEQAFESPGGAGDPARIHRLAVRLNSVYADLMMWSARIRGAGHPDTFERLFKLQSKLLDECDQSVPRLCRRDN